MTTISGAMATFNGAAHVSAQLQSLAKQTTRLYELVIVDDCSSDETMSMLEVFADSAPFPVRLVRNDRRLGYRASFIKAAGLCEGETIAFCDQDDVWRPTKIETLRRTFEENAETLLVYHNSLIVSEDGTPFTTTFPRKTKDHLLNKLELSPCIIIPGHALAFRRSLNVFSTLHGESIDPYSPNELMPHDIWIPFWASSLGQIKYLSDTLVTYRLHDANTSGWPVTRWARARDHIGNAQIYVHANRLLARNREELLRRARKLVPPSEFPSLDAAADFYRRFEIKAARRAEIYDQTSILARARAFLTFASRQNYECGSQCYGFDAVLLDLGIGVLCGWLGRPDQTRKNRSPVSSNWEKD